MLIPLTNQQTVSVADGSPTPVQMALPVTGLPQPPRSMFIGFVIATTIPSGSPTLDLWFQYSPDGGNTWQDFAHVQLKAGTLSAIVPVNLYSGGPTAPPPISDGSLAAGAMVQGPITDLIRIKRQAVMGTSGNWVWQGYANIV